MKYRAVVSTPKNDDWRVKIQLVKLLFPEWVEGRNNEEILAEFIFPVRTFEAAEKVVKEINDAC